MSVATLEPTLISLDTRETFLAPGQRYLSLDQFETVTVDRLVRDELGLLHAVMRTESGREISAFARQIEDAIADGALVGLGDTLVRSC